VFGISSSRHAICQDPAPDAIDLLLEERRDRSSARPCTGSVPIFAHLLLPKVDRAPARVSRSRISAVEFRRDGGRRGTARERLVHGVSPGSPKSGSSADWPGPLRKVAKGRKVAIKKVNSDCFRLLWMFLNADRAVFGNSLAQRRKRSRRQGKRPEQRGKRNVRHRRDQDAENGGFPCRKATVVHWWKGSGPARSPKATKLVDIEDAEDHQTSFESPTQGTLRRVVCPDRLKTLARRRA